MWWWTRPDDGLLQLVPCSREVPANSRVLQLANTTSPIWGAQTVFLNPDEPRTAEAHGAQTAYPFVSAVGAAWLLMAQANVAETRTIGPPAPEPVPTPDAFGGSAPSPPREPSTVTIVELRARTATAEPSDESRRAYSHRFPVSGHWRQQACGPNLSQRKPRYIGDYIKGPQGAPLIGPKQRVHVLRKPKGC